MVYDSRSLRFIFGQKPLLSTFRGGFSYFRLGKNAPKMHQKTRLVILGRFCGVLFQPPTVICQDHYQKPRWRQFFFSKSKLPGLWILTCLSQSHRHADSVHDYHLLSGLVRDGDIGFQGIILHLCTSAAYLYRRYDNLLLPEHGGSAPPCQESGAFLFGGRHGRWYYRTGLGHL